MRPESGEGRGVAEGVRTCRRRIATGARYMGQSNGSWGSVKAGSIRRGGGAGQEGNRCPKAGENQCVDNGLGGAWAPIYKGFPMFTFSGNAQAGQAPHPRRGAPGKARAIPPWRDVGIPGPRPACNPGSRRWNPRAPVSRKCSWAGALCRRRSAPISAAKQKR
jgi:hypothetical protein